MKTRIDDLLEEAWGSDYKRMNEQISKQPKGPHGFGDNVKYENGILTITNAEFEKLATMSARHGMPITLAAENAIRDHLEIGAEKVKVAGKPIKTGDQYLICDVRFCCLYELNKEQYIFLRTIFDCFLNFGTWPTARDLLLEMGTFNVRDMVKEFLDKELVEFEPHSETYRLTAFGILHLKNIDAIVRLYDFVMKRMQADIRERKRETAFRYNEFAEITGAEMRITKELSDSFLRNFGKSLHVDGTSHIIELPNDAERSSLILDYNNPISLCHNLFAKRKFYIYENESYLMDASEPLALKKGASQMDKKLIDARKVFIVHGHDEGPRESTARFVEKLGLSAIILHEQPNMGRTIIEKFEDYADVGYAIVLLTPDDLGASSEGPNDLRPRARQNVIFELGYFIGKLGRGHVAALYMEGVEIPSDYEGVIYIPLDKGGAWKTELAKELKTIWSDIDLNKLA